jgi:hypothetical protein
MTLATCKVTQHKFHVSIYHSSHLVISLGVLCSYILCSVLSPESFQYGLDALSSNPIAVSSVLPYVQTGWLHDIQFPS